MSQMKSALKKAGVMSDGDRLEAAARIAIGLHPKNYQQALETFVSTVLADVGLCRAMFSAHASRICGDYLHKIFVQTQPKKPATRSRQPSPGRRASGVTAGAAAVRGVVRQTLLYALFVGGKPLADWTVPGLKEMGTTQKALANFIPMIVQRMPVGFDQPLRFFNWAPGELEDMWRKAGGRTPA